MADRLPLSCPLKDKFRISSPYGGRIHPITVSYTHLNLAQNVKNFSELQKQVGYLKEQKTEDEADRILRRISR